MNVGELSSQLREIGFLGQVLIIFLIIKIIVLVGSSFD